MLLDNVLFYLPKSLFIILFSSWNSNKIFVSNIILVVINCFTLSQIRYLLSRSIANFRFHLSSRYFILNFVPDTRMNFYSIRLNPNEFVARDIVVYLKEILFCF